MRIKFLLFLAFTLVSFGAAAQEKAVTFTFRAGDEMFYKNEIAGNAAKLQELFALIDRHSEGIFNGQIPIMVDAYSTSGGSEQANKSLSFIRANRVKSELIEKKGLKEGHFTTRNLTESYEGQGDVVVVTLRVPQVEPKPQPKPEPKPEPRPEPKPEPKPEPRPEPQPEPQPEVLMEHKIEPRDPWSDNYCFALRTNLLYDAMLLPTLGIEWRASENIGIKLDASRSHWGSKTGNIQKIWMVSPEVRKYMGQKKRFYVGVGGNYGEYNIYKGMLGNLISKDTGYQGTFWNVGATVGYQLPLVKRLSLDFNLGLGYNQFKYDSFEMINEVRVYNAKGQTKNLFGPTQAGVSLVWRLGGNK